MQYYTGTVQHFSRGDVYDGPYDSGPFSSPDFSGAT